MRGCSSAAEVLAACVANEEVLPARVKAVAAAAAAVERLASMAQKARGGRQPGGLLEVSVLLAELKEARVSAAEYVERVPSVVADTDVLLGEWRAAFGAHCARCEETQALKDFVSKYSGVRPACEAAGAGFRKRRDKKPRCGRGHVAVWSRSSRGPRWSWSTALHSARHGGG